MIDQAPLPNFIRPSASAKTILAIDFDKWAAETYRANFPGVDVRCASVADEITTLPYADIITGGFPCQPHSLAGERKASADERDCGPDFVGAIRRVKPRMFLGENVAGILSSENGRYVQRLVASMEAAGYVVEVKLLDAVDFGVPQFRARVWFWGIRKDLHAAGMRHQWPAPTHCWPPQESGLFGEHGLLPGVTVGQALGINAYGGGSNHEYNRRARRMTHTPATTLSGTNGNDMPFVAPDDLGEHVDLRGGIHEYRWSAAMLEKHPPASPALDRPAPTLIGGSSESHTNGLSVVNDKKFRKEFGKITDNARHQPHQAANCLNSGGEGHGPTFANQHVQLSEDGRTWESRHAPALPALPAPTVRARSPRDGGRCTENVVKEGIMVRRLTPDECMRLMSVPDDFKWPEKITKTAKYKIAGNGWASRMGAVFAEAFRLADPESKTTIDLFCGGGLGASGWHGKFWSFETAPR